MKGEIVIEQARAWMRLNPKYCRVKATEMAAHLGVGGKSSGIPGLSHMDFAASGQRRLA